MELNELLVMFGEAVGIQGLGVGEDGVCRLDIDDMTVSFEENPATRELAIWARVGDEPQKGGEHLYRIMLKAMSGGETTDGAYFSIAEDDGIYLHRLANLETLTSEAFRDILGRFVNTLEQWRKICGGYDPIAAEIEAAEMKDALDERQFGAGDFLRV